MRFRFATVPLLCLSFSAAVNAETRYRYENFEMFVEPADLVVKEFASCRPTWPAASRINKESGTVEILMLVDNDGVVRRTKLVSTSGFRALDMATLKVYIGCQFKPAIVDGVPTPAWMSMKYVWTIE